MSESTPGVKVPRASDLMRRTVSLPASMSTPADLYSIASSEIQRADKRLHQPTAGGAVRRGPIGTAGEREETLLVEIFLEHVEPLGEEDDRVLAVAELLEQLHDERRVSERDGRQRQG